MGESGKTSISKSIYGGMIMDNRGRMINDSALIRQILKKWRRMILTGLILAVFAGGYQAVKLRPELHRDKNIQETPEGQIDQNAITAERALITQQMVNKNNYLQKSIKMRINSSCESRATMVFSIKLPEIKETEEEDTGNQAIVSATSEEGSVLISEDTAQTTMMLKAYRSRLISGFRWGDLPEQFNTEPEYLNELYGINQESEATSSITIVTFYLDEEGAKRIMEQIKEELIDEKSSVQAIFGKHELVFDEIQTGTIVDTGLGSWTRERVQELNNLSSEREKFDLASPGYVTFTSAPLRMRKRQYLMECFKMAAVGFFAGLVVYAVFRGLGLILTGKVLSARELNNQFRINKLAAIPDGCAFKGLDAVINGIDGDYFSNRDPNVSYFIANENVRNTIMCNSILKEKQAEKNKTIVALIGDLPEEDIQSVHKKLLTSEPDKNVEFIVASALNTDPEMLKRLEESDAVILVAEPIRSKYRTIRDLLKTVTSYDKEILGSIVIE